MLLLQLQSCLPCVSAFFLRRPRAWLFTTAETATLREGILGTARAVPSRRSGAGPADGHGFASRHARAAVGLVVRLEHVLDHVHDLRRSPPSLYALA